MAYVYPCVSCVSVELYVPSLRCHRLVLRPVKAMLDRNFRCTVTAYVLVQCSMRKPRAKSVYESRARVSTDQDDLSPGQPVNKAKPMAKPYPRTDWAERCEHETKDHKEFFLVAPVHLRRTSHDGLMMRRSFVQVWWPNSHVLAFYGGRSAPTRALSPSVRPRTATWTAGLQ